MPFSASTCLSYTGTTILTNPLTLYSDSDNYNISFGTLSLSAITGGNCPYVINNIPDETTKIKILSTNNYCVYIDISCNQVCDVCNLNFSAFTNTNSIGKLSIGELTGSCHTNISDYLINWYGPDSLTNLAFTSGKGTKYTYGYQQPFSDLIQVGGVYRPRLQKIILTGLTSSPTSGVTFSSTGGTGQVLADLNCLPNVTVQDFNCSNGNSATTYSHTMTFDAKSNGVLPTPLKAKFLLTGATNYFALSFNCISVPDTIKITFSGVNYSNPVVLENMILNTNGGLSYINPSTIPRQIYLVSYPKVLCLTGLTITPNDFLTIDVTPNTTNPDTSWNLSLKCFDTIDTTLGDYEAYKNTSFKLSASTITPIIGTCGYIRYTAKLIGGPIALPQIYNYLGGGASKHSPVNSNDNYGDMNLSGQSVCNNANLPDIGTFNCVSTGNTVIFNRTYNAITSAATYYMEFSNYFDFKNSYDSAIKVFLYSGTTNPAIISYYRFVYLRHYYSSINSPLTICGDNSRATDFYLHPPTMIVSSGMSASNYTLTVTQPRLPPANNFSFTNCQINCQGNLNYIINLINGSTTGATANNYISNVGLKGDRPFARIQVANNPSTTGRATASTLFDSYVVYNSYGNKMYPYSGTSTLIPSLSAITSSYIDSLPYNNALTNVQRLGQFEIRLPNLLNNLDYEIYARPISNYNYSGPYVLAYRYSGGVATYSSSTYII
jgi:hypothetical protein